MVEVTKIYLRDNDVMDRDAWEESLFEDIDKERTNESKRWGDHFNSSFICSYLETYGFVCLNGRKYHIKRKCVYDSVEELRDDLLRESLCLNEHDIIDEVIGKLTTEELYALFTKSDKLRFENGKIIHE